MSGRSAPAAGAVIHIVDDDDAMRDSLAVLMATRGLRVRTYENAPAFLAAAAQAEPGCLITDVQMPQMSGIDLLRELRRRALSFPAIVLCGRPTAALQAAARAAGASAFLAKPFDPAELAAAVRDALEAL